MTRTTRHSPSGDPASSDVWGLHEPDSGSVQYVLACPATRKAALIDIVQDFDPASARASTESARHVLELVASEGLEIEWILDTHPHADHLMAAAFLEARTGASMAIGEKVVEIAALWRELYHMPDAFDPERDFDRLFADGERFAVGGIEVRVMLSPGHTLGSISYVAGDAAFVLRGGSLPPAESDGHHYLKIPLDRLGRERPPS